MKTKIVGFLAAGLLAGPMTAVAATFTFSDPDQTVVRPASGTVTVDFYGTLALDQPGDSVQAFAIDGLFNGSGVVLDAVLIPAYASMTDPGNALRFSWIINSTAAPGLYVFDSASLVNPAVFALTFRSSTSGAQYTVSDEFSIHLVNPAAVPEPGSLALLGLGLAGIWWQRVRRPRAVSTRRGCPRY